MSDDTQAPTTQLASDPEALFNARRPEGLRPGLLDQS
jgi:hypothetical protein